MRVKENAGNLETKQESKTLWRKSPATNRTRAFSSQARFMPMKPQQIETYIYIYIYMVDIYIYIYIYINRTGKSRAFSSQARFMPMSSRILSGVRAWIFITATTNYSPLLLLLLCIMILATIHHTYVLLSGVRAISL